TAYSRIIKGIRLLFSEPAAYLRAALGHSPPPSLSPAQAVLHRTGRLRPAKWPDRRHNQSAIETRYRSGPLPICLLSLWFLPDPSFKDLSPGKVHLRTVVAGCI